MSWSGYLAAEAREARAAVSALDRYLFKVTSFKDSSFELVEQAHLAMSRLEQVRAWVGQTSICVGRWRQPSGADAAWLVAAQAAAASTAGD